MSLRKLSPVQHLFSFPFPSLFSRIPGYTTHMKPCGQCGKTIQNDKAAACPYCGANLITQQMSKAEQLDQIRKFRRKVRLGASAVTGILFTYVSSTIPNAAGVSATSFLVNFSIYFLATYLVISVFQLIVKPNV
jgi:DNA-directed RNA polymerase subunit RPC12/RpoP